MLLFSRFFYPLFTHARSATKRETHSRETSRKRGRHARTRLAFAHGVTSTILVRDANFARARSVGSRSRESRLYSVESRSSVPGSPAVPAYYSRESSRTARSLVHSVPGAVGCGNPPALYLLLSQLLSVSPLHSFSLTPSLFRSPTLSLSFFDSRFLSLSFFPSFSLTLSLFLFLPLPLSLALGYSFCTAHATKQIHTEYAPCAHTRNLYATYAKRRTRLRGNVDGNNEPRTIEQKTMTRSSAVIAVAARAPTPRAEQLLLRFAPRPLGTQPFINPRSLENPVRPNQIGEAPTRQVVVQWCIGAGRARVR